MVLIGEAIALEQGLEEVVEQGLIGAPEQEPGEAPTQELGEAPEEESEEVSDEELEAALTGLTVGELARNIREFSVTERDIVRAAKNARAMRTETEAARGGFQVAVTNFAMTYSAIGSKLPNDEQVAAFGESAHKVLIAATEGYSLLPRAQQFLVPDPFVPQEKYTNPAAIIYTHGLLHTRQIRTAEDEDAVGKFLEGAGVATSTVLAYLRTVGIRGSSLVELGEAWRLSGTSPWIWSDIIKGSVKPMYEELHRSSRN